MLLWGFLVAGLGLASGWVQNCCDLVSSQEDLVTCITQKSTWNHENHITKRVAIAMFASNKTMSYAPFTVLINSYYCDQKNYDFRLYTDANTPFSHTDKRWNKIGIVVDAFSSDGWGKDLEYLVVLDADLIITDFSLDIGSVATSYPNAHLLMSRDAADIANSGFLIVKHSDWVLNFFSLWWEKRFTSPTDQFAFNELFYHLGEPHEIALLPPSEINSEYPVYLTFSPQSRVLHLFGEIDEIRIEVFKFASSELCRYISSTSAPSKKRRGPKRYPPQLGLSSTKLREIALEQISLRRQQIKLQLVACSRGVSNCSDEDQLSLMEDLQRETSSLCGYGRGILAYDNAKECLALAIDNSDIIRPFTLIFPNDSLLYWDHLAQNLYAAFTWSDDSLDSIEMGEEVTRIQNQMIQTQQVVSLSPLIYRQSVLLAELSRRCDRLSVAEGNLSLKSRATTFAQYSLQWISLIRTKFGETDYETHVKGIVDSHLLLGALLLDSNTPAVAIQGLSPSGESEEERDGLEIALLGLKWSKRLFEECRAARSNEVESTQELLEESCSQVRDLILDQRKSRSPKKIKSVKLEEYQKIHQSMCSETAPL